VIGDQAEDAGCCLKAGSSDSGYIVKNTSEGFFGGWETGVKDPVNNGSWALYRPSLKVRLPRCLVSGMISCEVGVDAKLFKRLRTYLLVTKEGFRALVCNFRKPVDRNRL
jgi:hypothetical protein